MGPEDLNIDRYIPFKTVANIEAFCSDDDGKLHSRKHALLRRIQNGANTKDLSKFNGSLYRILFDPDFVIQHKWPVKKWVISLQKYQIIKNYAGEKFVLILFNIVLI